MTDGPGVPTLGPETGVVHSLNRFPTLETHKPSTVIIHPLCPRNPTPFPKDSVLTSLRTPKCRVGGKVTDCHWEAPGCRVSTPSPTLTKRGSLSRDEEGTTPEGD